MELAHGPGSRAELLPNEPDHSNEPDGVDVTDEATARFERIDRNIFVRVSNDASEHEESIPCHCRYDPATDERARACGEGSDCINRLVQMECNPLTCPCGSHCLNRRFQKHQYARMRVVDAGRKGYGMQALEDLAAGSFVMEYMGEVVTAGEFRKRARVYQAEGIQHHYFMGIGNGKVIDATRKGCVARFINHSCGPNCVLQKWMVGGAVRMGIFAERPIRRGEEITFDYKFERLADSEPQPCFCGAPECKGVIGVAKARAAPGAPVDDDVADIDEEIEDGAVTRRQRDDIRRRHAAVDDEDYDAGSDDGSDADGYGPPPARRRAAGLTSPEQVLKFVQIMHRSSRQTRIIGILIDKLLGTSDRRLLKALLGLQGAGILRAWLQDYAGDDVMLIKILQCVAHMPIATRNTIDESRLEEAVRPLCTYSDENVAAMAAALVERWASLRRVFKIPKKAKRDASAAATPAASARHSPSQTAGSSPAPPRWRNSPAPPQSRVRSASPMAPDSDARPHQRPPRHAGVAGWNRRGGFAASQPPHPGQRHRSAQHVPRSRSRSPQGPRRSAGPYGPSRQQGLHARQQQQRMPGGDRPYAMAAGSEGGRRPYADSRPDAARYSDPRTADAPVLAPGWRTAFTKDQVPYYYHESTKETQWEPPLAEPASRRGADGGAAGHFAQRRPDARDPRVYSATPADGPRARVDDIVDRAKRMGVQTPEQRQPQQPPPAGTVQLVTPETDGEPPAAGPANGLAASTQAARSAAPSSNSSSSANSSAGARRSSPDSGAPPPAAKRERLEKKAASELASFVVRAMNRYKAQMSHDEFKHEARKLSKILLEKERRGGAFDPQKLVELSAHKRAKIKQFVADYMGKLLARQSESNQ